ncbi:MAG: hypothetical protein WBA68_00825 [Alteraurantiacibacter sp.]
MTTKLDPGKAWNDAVALLSANMQVVLIVAGVFFFLPTAIAGIALPQPAELEAMAASGGEPDPEAMLAVLQGYYTSNWYWFLLLSLVQGVGMMALLALLTDSGRPTVGEALGVGAKSVLPYFTAQLLVALFVSLVIVVLVGVGALVNVAAAILLGLVGFVLAVYFFVKMSMIAPVIAIEKVLNPLRALQRSWALTKGNSLRLFGFYALLLLVLVVLTLLAGMLFSIFAIMGQQVGLFIEAIGGALISMATSIVMLGVLAAVHMQLSGRMTADNTADIFD